LFKIISNQKLKSYFRKFLPSAVWQVTRYILTDGIIGIRLAWLRSRMLTQKPNSFMRCLNYTLRITNGLDYYIQYKDIFIRRIYDFEARTPEPLIIDGGSNVGVSIFYFKHLYPNSRIIGFEPDPAIYCILQENVTCNQLDNVAIINAGLASKIGMKAFYSDSSVGGHMINDGTGVAVQVECLSDYLNEPVDFLKLNIEGEELSVLQEAETSGKIRNVRELILEYHGRANDEQRLGSILDLLNRQGYRYLVHDFDAETCNTNKPPFRLIPQRSWFCLVYARRLD
jgi:FkbM family methyltransferase